MREFIDIVHLMEAKITPVLEPTPANIALAKKYIFRKWIEREREVYDRETKWREVRGIEKEFAEPSDLSNGCKFSSLFCSVIFGGKMVGNYDHYFTILPNGIRLDLNDEAGDIKNMLIKHNEGTGKDPYRIDDLFMIQSLKADRRDVSVRVTAWLNEFCLELGLPNQFRRTSSGNIIPVNSV
jgi:hypothetical protein